jgi:hypothetical protein
MTAKRKSSTGRARQVRKTKTKRPRHRIIGLGQFDSGLPDLATNKEYMEGFGLSRGEMIERGLK